MGNNNGSPIDEQRLALEKKIFSVIDIDGDGAISIEELVQWGKDEVLSDSV